jgi:hypothetical protein
MAAARLGEPETAVDALLLPTAKNVFLPNGHNPQTAALPIYLPANGGLLAAIALTARGWDGRPVGGTDGSWVGRRRRPPNARFPAGRALDGPPRRAVAVTLTRQLGGSALKLVPHRGPEPGQAHQHPRPRRRSRC